MTIFQKLKKYGYRQLRPFGHIRFKEPIVVIESDDWGLMGCQPNVQWDPNQPLTDYATDQLETEAELDSLFALLADYEKDFLRAPIITANFIVSNPDFKETIASGFNELKLMPIDEAFPELMDKWKSGMNRHLFYPQYHGRLHYNYHQYQYRLQNDKRTQDLFRQRVNGGLENYKETDTDLHSEYVDWSSGKPISNLSAWYSEGLSQFKKTFGFESHSTICPNYILQPESIKDLSDAGTSYLQAANRLIYKTASSKRTYKNYCFGKQLPGGAVALNRNVRFEPCRNKKRWSASVAIEKSFELFDAGIPVVIDTHRMNYTGAHASASLRQLKELLEAYKSVKGLMFMTTTELGQAITNQGQFTNVWTGETQNLHLVDSFSGKIIRSIVS